jgi:hypothetical protein
VPCPGTEHVPSACTQQQWIHHGLSSELIPGGEGYVYAWQQHAHTHACVRVLFGSLSDFFPSGWRWSVTRSRRNASMWRWELCRKNAQVLCRGIGEAAAWKSGIWMIRDAHRDYAAPLDRSPLPTLPPPPSRTLEQREAQGRHAPVHVRLVLTPAGASPRQWQHLCIARDAAHEAARWETQAGCERR